MTGVFCVETNWFGYDDRSSVKPLLDVVRNAMDRAPRVVHRGFSTREELAFHLRGWRRSPRLSVLFVAAHGDPARIYVNHRRRESDAVSLDELAELLGTGCSDRIIHFGSCSTLRTDLRQIKRFIKRTGVLGVTGFTSDIDWLRSAMLELAIISTLLRYRPTLRGARRMAAALKHENRDLRRELGFRCITR